jgi:2-polyprenyl-3-methyl-5-hydroxy-6-metoxy-1,4-benzoquinol methylase
MDPHSPSPSACCPLCTGAVQPYHVDRRRHYQQCGTCRLVFVASDAHLSRADEQAIYDRHDNSPADEGYRRFLSRLYDPIATRLSAGSRGLDFGCGPGPTLSVMFAEGGYDMAIYDPLYAPDETVLATQYDFVTATEVVEHFRNPAAALATLWGCVKPGGYLGIMTKLVRDKVAFATWHYTHDATHICFFSTDTFAWLGTRWQSQPCFLGEDVIIFKKPLKA